MEKEIWVNIYNATFSSFHQDLNSISKGLKESFMKKNVEEK